MKMIADATIARDACACNYRFLFSYVDRSGSLPYARRVIERVAAVRRRVEAIPEGFVRTYADVCPGAPRFTGWVLREHGDDLPWHRVVRSDGTLAKGARQRALLEAEGIPFHAGRVDLRLARLPPDVDPA
jgi:alkylated DNA nucleotide flippase Atl1